MGLELLRIAFDHIAYAFRAAKGIETLLARGYSFLWNLQPAYNVGYAVGLRVAVGVLADRHFFIPTLSKDFRIGYWAIIKKLFGDIFIH
jgi:hypothetical protein